MCFKDASTSPTKRGTALHGDHTNAREKKRALTEKGHPSTSPTKRGTSPHGDRTNTRDQQHNVEPTPMLTPTTLVNTRKNAGRYARAWRTSCMG